MEERERERARECPHHPGLHTPIDISPIIIIIIIIIIIVSTPIRVHVVQI
jgi:uncharacterized protein (DUF983 family)